MISGNSNTYTNRLMDSNQISWKRLHCKSRMIKFISINLNWTAIMIFQRNVVFSYWGLSPLINFHNAILLTSFIWDLTSVVGFPTAFINDQRWLLSNHWSQRESVVRQPLPVQEMPLYYCSH